MGWLIFRGMTAQAFFVTVTVAMTKSHSIAGASFRCFENRCRLRAIRYAHCGEDVLDAPRARTAAARRVGVLPHAFDGRERVRPDGVLDGAEIDALAVADLLGPAGLLGR